MQARLVVAAPPAGRAARTASVFPLGFGGQAVRPVRRRLLGQGRQLVAKLDGIFPRHHVNRVSASIDGTQDVLAASRRPNGRGFQPITMENSFCVTGHAPSEKGFVICT